MKAIIVAAGTGGHITPGISIANKIMKEEPDSKIMFIGTKNGMENDIVSKAGYEVKHIRAEGMQSGFSIDNIRRLFTMFWGIIDSKKIIKEFKPDIVIGTGGYVSFPMFNVATKMKIPTILHESNSIPGKVVRVMSKKVNTIMIGFEETKDKIKGAKNVVYTGTPTKILNFVPSVNLREKLNLKNDLPVVLITGGSQGAKTLNDRIVDIITNNKEKKYQVVFVTGPKQYEIVLGEIKARGIDIDKLENVHILSYVYNMEEYMSVADLIISRAGALSLTEICVVGIPAIIIPYPYAAENHQVYNAQVLKNAGAAEVILQDDLTTNILENTLEKIIYNTQMLCSMKQQSKKLAVLNVEDVIYNEIKKII